MGLFWESFDGTKTKTQLKLAISRIGLLRNKKVQIVDRQKREIAALLNQNKIDLARVKAEHVIRESGISEGMDILAALCDLLLARFPLVEKHKTKDPCVPDIKELVSTIIWAAPRRAITELVSTIIWAEIQELQVVSKQLAIKYGPELATEAGANVGDCVNQRIYFSFNYRTPSYSEVNKQLAAIALQHGINWKEEDLVPPEVELAGYQVPSQAPTAPPTAPASNPNYSSNPNFSEAPAAGGFPAAAAQAPPPVAPDAPPAAAGAPPPAHQKQQAYAPQQQPPPAAQDGYVPPAYIPPPVGGSPPPPPPANPGAAMAPGYTVIADMKGGSAPGGLPPPVAPLPDGSESVSAPSAPPYMSRVQGQDGPGWTMPQGPPTKVKATPTDNTHALTVPESTPAVVSGGSAGSAGGEGGEEETGGLLDLPPPPKDDSEGVEVGKRYWHQSDQGNFSEVTLVSIDRAANPRVYTVDAGGGQYMQTGRERLFEVRPPQSGPASVPDFDELEARLAALKGPGA